MNNEQFTPPDQQNAHKLFAALHALWVNQHDCWEYANGKNYFQCKTCGEVALEMSAIDHKTGCPVAAAHKTLRGEE